MEAHGFYPGSHVLEEAPQNPIFMNTPSVLLRQEDQCFILICEFGMQGGRTTPTNGDIA